MANNIIVGRQVVYAKQTVPIASTGISAGNTVIIYEMNPTLSPSYVPGRTINPITNFSEGKGYLLIATAAMDLTEYLMPPFPAGEGILLEDGGSIIVE